MVLTVNGGTLETPSSTALSELARQTAKTHPAFRGGRREIDDIRKSVK